MKYFSMYSGVGGFEYGIQEAIQSFKPKDERLQTKEDSGSINSDLLQRATCVGYSEIDKHAIAVYKYNYGTDIRNYGNADEINAEELPDFDLLVGGFPCQAFSIAGKRRGFYDTRGTQFFNVARIAKQKQPRLLVLENVKGLLSHDKGQTFHTIIATLDELGYDVEWQVLNSKNHGVPQNRERVFIIGRLRGTGGRQVFPFTGENRGTIESDSFAISNASKRERRWNQKVSPTLCARDYKEPKIVAMRGRSPKNPSDREDGSGQPCIIKTQYGPHQQDAFYDIKGIAPTIPAGTHGSTPHLLKCKTSEHHIRRLTPRECERLQGFPDDWTKYGIIDGEVKEMSNTQRYKMMGNAVTTNVVRDIMSGVL